MITVTHLSKKFATSSGPVYAVQDIDFSVPDASCAAIVGKSGSGKSTLLSLLGGLDKPSTGSIRIGDNDITRFRDRKLTRYRGKNIGFVFQSFNLIPNLTALENVMLPMEFARVPRKKRKLRAIAILNQVGIVADKQQRKPSRLSGGEQQRVAIARALANRPAIILADEPTGNLDSETGRQIFDLLRLLSTHEQTTVIIVTHDQSLASQCDQILTIADGKLSPDNASVLVQ
jgi:putative ABC transport system ATP-binding protein